MIKCYFEEGLLVGAASLIGVYFGIKTKNATSSGNYKQSILFLNFLVLIIMLYKTFF